MEKTEMRRLIALYAMAFSFACLSLCATEKLLWNQDNSFGGWKAFNSLKAKFDNELLRLTLTGHDPQLGIRGLNINASDYKSFQFKYRVVSGIQKNNYGNLFFQTAESKAFKANLSANFSLLKTDGEWHVMDVSLENNDAWKTAGVVTGLRFDPVESAPGELELESLALIPFHETSSGPLEDVADGRLIAFDGDYQVSEESPFMGTKCMMQGMRADGEEVARSKDAYPVKPGTLYQIAVYARNSIATGNVMFGIGQSRTSPESKMTRALDWKWNQLTCNASEWRRSIIRVRTSHDTNGIIIFFKTTSNGLGNAWWDRLTITELEEETLPFTVEPFDAQISLLGMPLLHAEHVWKAGKSQRQFKWIEENLSDAFLTAHCNETSPGTKLRLEIIGGNGLVHSAEQEAASVNRFRMPVEQLPAGRFAVNLSLVSREGNILHHFTMPLYRFEPFKEAMPLPPIESVTVTRDNLFVNGKPFHWSFMCHYPIVQPRTYFDEMEGVDDALRITQKLFGINIIGVITYRPDRPRPSELKEKYLQTAIDYYSAVYLKQLDWCRDHQVYAWASLHVGETLRPYGKPEHELLTELAKRISHHPALLGWDYDEPEAHKLTQEEVEGMVKAVKEGDPKHPVIVNLCQPWNFYKFINSSDVASYDYYPFPNSSLKERRSFTEQMRAVSGDKLFVTYQQMFQFAVIEDIPTLDFALASFAMDTIDDCRNLLFYSWCEMGNHSMLTDRAIQSQVVAVSHMATELYSFLDAAVREPMTLVSTGDVITGCWRTGDERCLIIVNLNGEKKATVALPKANDITDFIDGTWHYQPEASLPLQPYGALFLRLK